MKERVTTRFGTSNVVLVCPHGHDLDDTNTGLIALTAADILDAHAIVNNGWKRAKAVDELRSEANCNDIDHCSETVVQAEFLDPIMSAIDSIVLGDMGIGGADVIETEAPFIFMIHGIGNSVRTKAGDPKLDLIVGFGAGDKPYYTCEEWQRNCFMDFCAALSWRTYAGAPGGAYSARSKKNLTQAIHRETAHPVLQLEFIYARRNDDATAKKTGQELAAVIKSMLSLTDYARPEGTPVPPEI